MAARWWKLGFTGTIDAPKDGPYDTAYLVINELEWYADVAATVPLVPEYAEGTDVYDGSPAEALDGDISTFWESDDYALDGEETYFTVRFPTPVTPALFVIGCDDYEPDERPTSGRLSSSDDGVTWTLVSEWEITWAGDAIEYQPVIIVHPVQPIDATLATQWAVTGAPPQINATLTTQWGVSGVPVDTSRFVIPDYPVTELWTFQTSIFRSRNGNEERRARVLRPVVSQQYRAPSLEPLDFQVTRRTLEIDTDQFYPVPLFQYYAFLEQDAPAGTVRFYFNQARTNVVPGQHVAFTAERFPPLVGKVRTVHADSVTLMFPFEVDITRDYAACPVVFCRLGANASTAHSPVHAYTTFSFVSAERELDFVRPGNNIALPLLDDLPLLMAQRISADSSITETLISGNTTIDNARANPVMFVKEATRRQFALSYKVNREIEPEAMDFWRMFFGTIRGAQKPFALPTFRPDALPAPVSAGDLSITLAGADFYEVWARGGYVGLALGVGERLALEPCRVLDVAEVDGNSVCQLAAPTVGGAYDVASFIMSVRCATDQVTLSHTDFETFLSFTVQSVKV